MRVGASVSVAFRSQAVRIIHNEKDKILTPCGLTLFLAKRVTVPEIKSLHFLDAADEEGPEGGEEEEEHPEDEETEA